MTETMRERIEKRIGHPEYLVELPKKIVSSYDDWINSFELLEKNWRRWREDLITSITNEVVLVGMKAGASTGQVVSGESLKSGTCAQTALMFDFQECKRTINKNQLIELISSFDVCASEVTKARVANLIHRIKNSEIVP